MKLHFEEEDLTERQECSALTSNMKGQPKKQYPAETLLRRSLKSCKTVLAQGYKDSKR